MKKPKPTKPDPDLQTRVNSPAVNAEVCLAVIKQLFALRTQMLDREAALHQELSNVSVEYRESARNLIHYLTLRTQDLRPLQEKLSWLGLSSLGRSESHALANLDKVLGNLHRLTGQSWKDKSEQEPAGSVSSRHLLEQHSNRLLGEPRSRRQVRIMVTLPSEAAVDFSIARKLVDAGMDIARINCAHDGPPQWKAMAANVRRAAKAKQRKVRVLMDLGGPKVRTGEVESRPAVLKLRPQRDELGRVLHPARLGLWPTDTAKPSQKVDASLGVDRHWLARLTVGSQIDLSDARGAKRHLTVVQHEQHGTIAEGVKTCYITSGTVLRIRGVHDKRKSSATAGQMDHLPGALHLQRGDLLLLTKKGLGQTAVLEEGSDVTVTEPASISCTLPQIIDQVRAGERIWFDDGRIGGVVRRAPPDHLEVEITQARAGGEKLVADKGINLPDSALDLPALTAKDIQDLTAVASHADMVGLSFVQKPSDVDQLREHLHRLGKDNLGIVLKIETIQGFENLPELMLAAMAGPCAGVMIARGDLAVECGYERLAEVQEEILWCAEAAHMPVIWATQVLETLAKTGQPSRAEISDAALGGRAECVMLNKGPYITDAIHTLDDILRRMAAHQAKKRPLLRALHAWRNANAA